MNRDAFMLIPTPQRLTRLSGNWSVPSNLLIHDVDRLVPLAEFERALQTSGRVCTRTPNSDLAHVVIERNDGRQSDKEGYELRVQPHGPARISCRTAVGARHALRTLVQLISSIGHSVPALEIEDWPDFPIRGVMLDISRDRVPTMQTLFHVIDRLAMFKINHLELYMEHTFAYSAHERIWRDSSPLTADEMRALDQYCRERGLELCANQNTLGHMSRWLTNPHYAHLSEMELGQPWVFETDDGRRIERSGPFSLRADDSHVMQFLDELLGELVPCTSGRFVNVGCDEAFDIGAGASASRVDQSGRLGLILRHLRSVSTIVKSHHRTPCFWADMLLRHPAHSWGRSVPDDSVALAWGYESDSPFETWCEGLRSTVPAHWVCPGTSAWLSFTGRTEVRKSNIAVAARAGRASGAGGFMITNWGDGGHRQQLPIELFSIAHGAHAAWNAMNADQFDDRAAAVHLFGDKTGRLGPALTRLGDADSQLRAAASLRNRGAFYEEFHRAWDDTPKWNIGSGSEGLWLHAQSEIDSSASDMASCSRGINSLVKRELELTVRIAHHAAGKALEWLRCQNRKASRADAAFLHADMCAIIQEHDSLWIARSRPGGLPDSRRHYEAVLQNYSDVISRC